MATEHSGTVSVQFASKLMVSHFVERLID